MIETITPVAAFKRRGEKLIRSAEMLAGWEDLRFWRLQRDRWARDTTDALREAYGPRTAQLFECSASASRVAGELCEVLPEELRRARDALAVLEGIDSDHGARDGNDVWLRPPGARVTR